MSKHVVILDFRDLQDADHVYRVGDIFPRKGKAKKARLEELSGPKNKIGKAVIQEVVAPELPDPFENGDEKEGDG